MTHHYNIEITLTKTHLKVTYRDNKFRKLEHLRGVIEEGTLKAIGKIIPPTEEHFDMFMKTFKGKIDYTLQTKEKSLYSQFNSEWHKFYEEFTSLPPKFSGADGKSLKSIITYLQKVSINSDEALTTWKLILDKWTTLNNFHKSNTDLKYINSKLNIIIDEIKRKNDTQKHVKSATSSEVGKQFKFK